MVTVMKQKHSEEQVFLIESECTRKSKHGQYGMQNCFCNHDLKVIAAN